MARGSRIYSNASDKLSRYLRENGLRPSSIRKLVLERVCALPQPFTAKQLEEVCVAERISVGTIYNSLQLFVLAQILHATQRQRGKAATEYELITNRSALHMQIICTKCGRMQEIQDKAIAHLLQERKYTNFSMQNASVFVYGECKICRRKKSKKALDE